MRIPSEMKFFEALVREVRAFAPLRVNVERRRLKESGQPIIAGLLNRISPGAVEQGLIAAGIPRLSLQHIEHSLLSRHALDEWERWKAIPVVQPDGAWLAAGEPFDTEVQLLGKRLDVVGIGYAGTEEILQVLHRQTTSQSPSATVPVSTVTKPLPARARKVLQALQLQVEIPHTAAYQVERYLIASGELTEWAVYSELSRATGWPLWADLERITIERLNIAVEHLQVLLVRRGSEKFYLTSQAFIEEELAAAGLERHPIALTYPEMWDVAYRSSQQVAEAVSKPRSVLEALYRQGRVEQSFYQEWQADPRSGENQLIARGLISEEQFTEARAQVLKMPYIDLLNEPPELAVRKHISDAYTLSLRAIPHHINEIGELVVVVGDPEDIQRNDELKMLLRNTPLRLALASPGAIQRIIMRNYGQQRDLQEVTTFLAGEEKAVIEDLELEGGALDRLVNSFIREAVLSDASDIHIESHKNQGVVRMRRDGLLHEYTTLPLRSVPAVIQKIKVRAALDITERRVPQDGRFRFNDAGIEVNVRVSTVLTMYGEKVVMRLLKSEGKVPLLTEAGFQSDTLAQLRRIIQRPHGLFLITGPTGSGKTRTGIAALAELARPEVNVLTVEDPVEYEVPGINQVQVNPQAKVTFGSVLRAFLRQDPDIIYVGEIRDRETAQVATQAAFTGHLVIATLHTNDAPSSVTRLVDLGVDPANVSAALLGVLAQRLVRKVCRHCAIPDHDQRSEQLLSRPLVEAVLANPEGCRHCYSGYVGRTGIFELMEVSQEMQSLLAQGPSMDQIRELAREQGMRSLMEDGVLKVEQGITTAEEVLAKTMA